MKHLARILSVALAISFMGYGTADAGRAARGQKAKTTNKAVSGQKARSAIVRNRQAKGKSNLHLKVRRTQQHKKMTEFTAADGKGKVTKYQVAKDGSYAREAGGKTTQAQARKTANQKLHRENGPKKGQFSGVRNSGTTASGNYEFRSKTNPKEKVVIDANSGKARNYDKRK